MDGGGSGTTLKTQELTIQCHIKYRIQYPQKLVYGTIAPSSFSTQEDMHSLYKGASYPGQHEVEREKRVEEKEEEGSSYPTLLREHRAIQSAARLRAFHARRPWQYSCVIYTNAKADKP